MAIELIKQALSSIILPGFDKDIISMRMLGECELKNDDIQVQFILPSMNFEHKSTLLSESHRVIQESFPDHQIHIHFKEAGTKSQGPNTLLPQIDQFIAVASGKGGVGKSTVAVNLALSLKEKGYRVGLMDADLYGPSLPIMLGLRNERPRVVDRNGKQVIQPLNAYEMPFISIGNIVDPEQAVVLRGPRLAGIIKQFILECNWPELDFLIIDLPPGTGDIQLTLVQTIPLTGAVMVTTPQEVAVADAVKAANMFRLEQIQVPVLGVVENMSFFVPDDAPEKRYDIFGSGGGEMLAHKTQSALLGQIPIRTPIREGGDTGLPVAQNKEDDTRALFRTIAQNLLERVEWRNTHLDATRIVQTEK